MTYFDGGSRGRRNWQSGLLPSKRGGDHVDPTEKPKRQNHKTDAIRLRKELAIAQAVLARCREALV